MFYPLYSDSTVYGFHRLLSPPSPSSSTVLDKNSFLDSTLDASLHLQRGKLATFAVPLSWTTRDFRRPGSQPGSRMWRPDFDLLRLALHRFTWILIPNIQGMD